MSSHKDGQRDAACLRVCVRVPVCLSAALPPCDVLSIERVVICKSPLPWTGGVKVGEQDRKSERGTGGERWTETVCE